MTLFKVLWPRSPVRRGSKSFKPIEEAWSSGPFISAIPELNRPRAAEEESTLIQALGRQCSGTPQALQQERAQGLSAGACSHLQRWQWCSAMPRPSQTSSSWHTRRVLSKGVRFKQVHAFWDSYILAQRAFLWPSPLPFYRSLIIYLTGLVDSVN